MRERGCVQTIAVNIANEMNIIKVCNVCDELRLTLLKKIAKRSWKVIRNISLDRIPGDYVLEYQRIDSGKRVVNSYY